MNRDTFSTITDSKTLKGVLLAACLLAAPVALTACNTTEGFGRDMESLGDNIEDAADDAND